MKTNILFLCSILLISCHTKKNIEDHKIEEIMIDEHNSMNALDWQGTYTGVLPCADCDGIETILILYKDLHYTMQQRYKGKENIATLTNGTFRWDKKGQIITLDNQKAQQYFVGEHLLHQLNLSGKKITGKLAQQYILSKEFASITDSHWALVSLYGKTISFDKIKDTQPYFILKPSEGNLFYGNGGCNPIRGTFEVFEGQRLHFKNIISTKMACMNLPLEERFLTVLKQVDNYNIQGDTLTLQKAKMAPLAKFVKRYFQ
ncbi:copper resistance protein NlpE N-terminal domain-containing protein [Flavobacteriaceae bacterium F08102]|nr:copper resistance protein NlpE N-terminal domain-containing protein [Flavobacteriaceae bacterium F08102]